MLGEYEAVFKQNWVYCTLEVVGSALPGSLVVAFGPVSHQLVELCVAPVENGCVVGDWVVGLAPELDGYFEVFVGVELLPDLALVEELGLEVVALEVVRDGGGVEDEAEEDNQQSSEDTAGRGGGAPEDAVGW